MARSRFMPRAVLASVVAALGTYIFFGLHLWLLADTREGLTISPLALCIGTMAIAMLAGVAFFMLPSGVGAREFVIVVALTPVVGIGRATAYAAVSRAMFTLAELVSAGTAAAVAVLSRRREGGRANEVAPAFGTPALATIEDDGSADRGEGWSA